MGKIIGLGLIIGVLAACNGGGGGGGGSSGGASAPTVVGLSISLPSATVRHGDPLTLTARLTLSDGSTQPIPAPGSAQWTSSERSIAEVTATPTGDGQVTTKFRGQVTITATYQGLNASVLITITPVLARVIVDNDPSTMPPAPPGGGLPALPSPIVGPPVIPIPPEFVTQLFAFAQYSDGVIEDVTESATWSIAHPNLATVSDNVGTKGFVEALRSGRTTISIAYAGQAANTVLNVMPTRLIGQAGFPFGPMTGLTSPMATIDGQGRATAGWSFQLTGEVFSGGHDGTDWTARLQINSNQNPNDQAILTAVTSNSAGARLIVWYGISGLYASYARPGEPFMPVENIPRNAPTFETVNAAVVTDTGEAIVLWTDGRNNVYINRFDPTIGTWSQPIALAIAIPFGSVAFNSNGDAVLAWQIEEAAPQRYTHWSAIFVNGSGPGSGLQPARALSTPTPLLDLGLSVAINSARAAVVTWTAAPTVADPPLLYAAQYSTALGWHTIRTLPMGTGTFPGSPVAAINTAGDIVVAWVAGGSETYANRFTQARGWEAAEQLTGSPSQNTPQIFALAIAASGNAICFVYHTPSIVDPTFRYRRYIVGQGWQPLTILEDPGVVGNPNSSLRAAYNANGEGVLVWSEAGNIPNGNGGLFSVNYGFMELGPTINP